MCTSFMIFRHVALNNQLYICERVYNLFVSFQKKVFLSNVSHRRGCNLYLSALSTANYFLLPSPFLSRFCDVLKPGHKHDSFVWLLHSECCILRGASEQYKLTLTMHHMSGWKLIPVDWLPFPWTSHKQLREIFSLKPSRPQLLSSFSENYKRMS